MQIGEVAKVAIGVLDGQNHWQQGARQACSPASPQNEMEMPRSVGVPAPRSG
jgi:hypothetical protein